MNNTSENTANASPETDRPDAGQSVSHAGPGGADPWPAWLSRRLQFAIPAWALAAGAVVLLLIALD